MSFNFDIKARIENGGELLKGAFLQPFHLAAATVVGIAGTVASILTGGTRPNINIYADYTRKTRKPLPKIVKLSFRVLNPSFPADVLKDGILTENIAKGVFREARVHSNSKDNLEKHVYSRGEYAIGALLSIMTRTADLAIGVIATALALVFFGQWKDINDIALRHLTFFGVIDDVCTGLRGLVNPKQFKDSLKFGL